MHRLVAVAFLGVIPKGLEVNHIDGTKTNNCVANLEFVTGLENNRHAALLGLKPARERHGSARLNESAVSDIRNRAGIVSQKSLAAEYNVSPSAVSLIVSGRTWNRGRGATNAGLEEYRKKIASRIATDEGKPDIFWGGR